MNKHPYYTINIENGARIIFTPCPGTKNVRLEASIKNLKQVDSTMLLTLMFDDEMRENHIQSISNLCKRYDMTWLQLAIVDDDIPNKAFEYKWKKYRQLVLSTLRGGGCIIIHCKGGTGRTGLVAAMILSCYGWPISKVISCIQNIRPNALKNTNQLAYLHLFINKTL